MATSPPPATALVAIGNTPIVKRKRVIPPGHADAYLKLENLNPTGSYKDRMARSIIEEAERRGDLKPGMKVVEATGCSTAEGDGCVWGLAGYHSESNKGYAAELIPAMVRRAQSLTEEGDVYLADQFNNRDVLMVYRSLADELVAQLPDGIDGFCAAVGGAGMAMGVARVLKDKSPDTRVIVLELESAPLITQGRSGTHSVEGLGIGFFPPLLDK
ncbi:hypothetical protein ACJZ2D_002089 [Fusarium nematophilum]